MDELDLGRMREDVPQGVARAKQVAVLNKKGIKMVGTGETESLPVCREARGTRQKRK